MALFSFTLFTATLTLHFFDKLRPPRFAPLAPLTPLSLAPLLSKPDAALVQQLDMLHAKNSEHTTKLAETEAALTRAVEAAEEYAREKGELEEDLASPQRP